MPMISHKRKTSRTSRVFAANRHGLASPRVGQPNRARRGAGKKRKDFSTGVCWVLLLAGLGVLGACIIVPAWLSCQQLAVQQRELTEQLAQLNISNKRYQEAIEAAPHDAAFNERLLIEGLNYHRPGEQVLLVASGPQTPITTPVTRPRSTRCKWVWLQAFSEHNTRNVLLIMSTGLVFFAFIYYRPKSRWSQTKPSPQIPVHPAPAEYSAAASGHHAGW